MNKPLPPPWDNFVPFLRRLLIWVLFFGALWVLRPFFFLVFLTFVFGYVMSHTVTKLKPRIDNRTARVVSVFLVLLALLVGIGFFVAPDLVDQAKRFPTLVQKNLGLLDDRVREARDKSPVLQALLPDDLRARDVLAGFFSKDSAAGTPVEQNRLDLVMNQVRMFAERTFFIASSFLLALLFSFLVVLDLPKIAKGIKRLHDTRFGYVYDELSDSVLHFGSILGRALEAQLMIAIVNTSLTAIGLAIMGLPSLSFLSLIVFICSFIPVAGVFISSVPICLTALVESGVGLFFISIAFITVIHMIEAYILNPRIYGAHLRMNPVLVLAILVISHHLFGVWGLVLGVPVTNFVIQYVLHYATAAPATPDAPRGAIATPEAPRRVT